MNTFDIDNYLGSKDQPRIAQTLCDYKGGSGIVHATGYFPDWDFSFQVSGNAITIEAKRDERSRNTGNVFLPTGHANGSPAGLTATKANFVCYHIPHLEILAVFPPRRMVRYMETHNLQKREFNWHGNRPDRPNGNENGQLMRTHTLTGLAWVSIISFKNS